MFWEYVQRKRNIDIWCNDLRRMRKRRGMQKAQQERKKIKKNPGGLRLSGVLYIVLIEQHRRETWTRAPARM